MKLLLILAVLSYDYIIYFDYFTCHCCMFIFIITIFVFCLSSTLNIIILLYAFRYAVIKTFEIVQTKQNMNIIL